jgi:hypothetical protein
MFVAQLAERVDGGASVSKWQCIEQQCFRKFPRSLKERVTRGAVKLVGDAASFVSRVSTLHIMRDCDGEASYDSPRRTTTLMQRHPDWRIYSATLAAQVDALDACTSCKWSASLMPSEKRVGTSFLRTA